jgi:predicted dehydrogenase
MEKYSQISIQYLCDSNNEMLLKAASMVSSGVKPELFHAEKQLLERVDGIDLLVIATPNYMHTPHILRWAHFNIVILVEKPVAISEKQVQALRASSASFKAKIWVAMEYR